MKLGGRVMLRSAGLRPWYITNFEEQGFRCERVAARTSGACIDRHVLVFSARSLFLTSCTRLKGQHVCLYLDLHESTRGRAHDAQDAQL